MAVAVAVAVASLLADPAPARAQPALQGASAAAELVLGALGLLGVPYRFGGSDPASGLDCSGLVHFVARSALGLQLPRQSEAMSRAGVAVDRHLLQPGDLVFFDTLGRPFSHVGVYLGDEQFVHAPAGRGRVRIEAMSQPYWRLRFNGARRIEPVAGHEPIIAAAPSQPAGPSKADDPFGLAKP